MIHSEDFDPEETTTRARFPEAVKRAAAKGQEITWGFFPKSGKPATATFRIGGSPQVDADLAKIGEALQEQDPLLIAHMHANVLLKHGLFYSAYQAAVDRASSQGYAIMQAALKGMELESSALWTELAARVDELPPR